MADDFQEKTEDASSKKLQDAREKGKVARSSDLISSSMLLVALLSLYMLSTYIFIQFELLFQDMFENIRYPVQTIGDAGPLFWKLVLYFLKIIGPYFLLMFFFAIVINVAQVGLELSIEPLFPKWDKVNIFDIKNYKKFFNSQALMRLLFGLSKMVVITIISYYIILPSIPTIASLIYDPVINIFVLLFYQSFKIGVIVALLLCALGLADFGYQKWKFGEDMKMSKQEMKEERRQSEGDAHTKGRMRSMIQGFIRHRMKDSVPKADVIVANPIHYAIALKYDAKKMGAPICVAKGMRKMALVIRKLAEESGVPVVENPPLARSLYKVIEVGMVVPPDFYKSIAEVLAYVYRLNDKLKKKAKE